jgi:hypothetical protein
MYEEDGTKHAVWGGEEAEPDEQKEIIKPLKCCGGFKMLHAIQPKMPPATNVIAILTGINHLRTE